MEGKAGRRLASQPAHQARESQRVNNEKTSLLPSLLPVPSLPLPGPQPLETRYRLHDAPTRRLDSTRGKERVAGMAPELVRTFVVVKPSEHDAETGMANPAKASVVSCMAQGVVRIRNEIRNRSNEYTVDGTSAATASPNENYEQLAKPLVEHVVAGGDATMIFYGAADSGKTHTAFGSYLAKSQAAQTSHGLIHRAASEVFAAVAKRPARGGGASTGISLSVVDVYIAAARDVGKFVLAPPPESAMPSTTRKVAARGRISPATVASLPPVAVDEVEGGAYDAQVYRHPVASASELSESVIKVLKRRAALAGGVGQSKRAHTIVSVYVPSPAGASSENTESIQ